MRTLLTLAHLEAKSGQIRAAADAYARVLAIASGSGAELDQVAALAGRAQLNLAQGKAEAALADASRAIEVLEALGEAGMHAQQRVVFLGSQRRVFELAIAAQLELAAAAERKGNRMRRRRDDWLPSC